MSLLQPVPAGYIELLLGRREGLVHPSLDQFYRLLRVVVSEPPFSWQRMKNIVKFNLGRLDSLVDDYVTAKAVFPRSRVQSLLAENFLDTPSPRENKIQTRWFDLLALFALVCIVFPFALQRLVAGDEGFYLYAAKLVTQGKVPYRDFFYPQTLYLPYFYAAWLKCFGVSWDAARLLSACFGVGLGFLLYRLVSLGLRLGPAFGFAALILFVGSGWTLPWVCIAKAYGGALFFLFFSYYVLILPGQSKRSLLLFLAGLLFSLAVGFRLYVATVFPVFLALVAFGPGLKLRPKRELAWFLLGCCVGALPFLVSMLSDFDLFYYNNVTYHVERSSVPFDKNMSEKLRMLLKLFGLVPSEELVSWHFPILFAIACLEFPLALMQRRMPHSSLFTALLLLAASIVPSPGYFQYFCLVYPFLLVTVFHLLSRAKPFLAAKLHSRPRLFAPGLFVLTAIATFLYLRSVPAEWSRYTKTGYGLIGVTTWDSPKTWRLKTLKQASALVDKLVNPGDPVLAMWPGHLFASKADVLSGSENQFAVRASARLPLALQERYHLMSAETMRKLLEHGKVRLFVKIKSQMLMVRVSEEELTRWGYRQAAKIEGIRFYVKAGNSAQRSRS